MGLYLEAILLPDGSVANGAAPVGEATIHAALGDGLDTSYVSNSISDVAFGLTFGAMGAPPVGSQITGVQAIVRANRPTIPAAGQKWYGAFQVGAFGIFSFTLNNLLTSIEYWDSPIYAKRPDGRPWTLGDIQILTAVGSGLDFSLPAGERARIYEFIVQVFINRAPTITSITPSGTITDTTRPQWTWVYTDLDLDPQERIRIKVFSGSGSVLDPDTEATRLLWDSGEMFTGVNTFKQTVPILANASYRVAIKAADAGSNGAYGLWTQVSLTITIPQPAVPTATVVANQTENRYDIRPEVGTGGAATTDFFVVERSDDVGVTWEKVTASQIRHGNLDANSSSFETTVGGWVASADVAATYPQRSNAQAQVGSWSLVSRSASGGVMDILLDTFRPSTPGVVYEVVLPHRAATTPTFINVAVLWYDADGVLIQTDASPFVVESNAVWGAITYPVTAPAGSTQYKLRVRWTAPPAATDHYIDGVTVKPLVSDYRSPRHARLGSASNDVRFRVTAGHYLTGDEYVLSDPLLLIPVSALLNDCRTWLKHPTDPTLNIVINDLANMVTNTNEDMAALPAAGRADYAVFSGTVRLPTGKIELQHVGDAQEAAFDLLRASQVPLLLQTVYGDTLLKQMWVRLGPDLAKTWVTADHMETVSYTRGSIGFWSVAAPAAPE